MASIFSKIIEGSIPSVKIDETENEIAFLDIMPCAEGHTLIVPKKEVERFEDMDPQDTASLMKFLHRIAKAVSSAFGGVDYNVILNNGVQAGQEVMHVHFTSFLVKKEHPECLGIEKIFPLKNSRRRQTRLRNF